MNIDSIKRLTEFTTETFEYNTNNTNNENDNNDTESQSPICDLSDDSDNYNEPEIIQELNEIINQSKELINSFELNITIRDKNDKETIQNIHEKMNLIITNICKKIKNITDEKIEINILMTEQLNKSKENLLQLNLICNSIYEKYKSK